MYYMDYILQQVASIYINGNLVDIKDANEAIKVGLGMVHQHFMLIKPFTVS